MSINICSNNVSINTNSFIYSVYITNNNLRYIFNINNITKCILYYFIYFNLYYIYIVLYTL